jgi:hypothetical protein
MEHNKNITSTWLNSNWLLVGILFLAAALVWGTLREGHSWGDDFAGYIMQAQSIFAGSIPEFLAQNDFTIRETALTLGPVAYPWGTALLLSAIIALKGLDIQALKALNIACFFCFLILIWFWFRKYFPPGWGLLYVALFAFNPTLIGYLNEIGSDIPFLLFSTICVVLIRRFVLEKKYLISRPVDSILIGLAIAFSSTIRINGILLLGVFVIAQAYQNKRDNTLTVQTSGILHRLSVFLPQGKRDWLIQSLPVLVFLLFSIAWMPFFPGSLSYSLAEFNRLKFLTFLYHIHYYLYTPLEFFYPLDQSWLLFSIFLFFTTWGFVRLYFKDLDFAIYYSLTLLLCLVWPPLQGIRFIFAILPLSLYFFMAGMDNYASEIQEKLGAPVRKGMTILLIGVVVIFITFLTRDAVQNLNQGRMILDSPYTKDAQETMAFISTQTRMSDVIVFFKPRALRLYTQRPSVANFFPQALELGNYILMKLDLPPGWNPLSLEQAASLASAGRLDLVFQNATFRLYRVNH